MMDIPQHLRDGDGRSALPQDDAASATRAGTATKAARLHGATQPGAAGHWLRHVCGDCDVVTDLSFSHDVIAIKNALSELQSEVYGGICG
jgi:hypothetical protein